MPHPERWQIAYTALRVSVPLLFLGMLALIIHEKHPVTVAARFWNFWFYCGYTLNSFILLGSIVGLVAEGRVVPQAQRVKALHRKTLIVMILLGLPVILESILVLIAGAVLLVFAISYSRSAATTTDDRLDELKASIDNLKRG